MFKKILVAYDESPEAARALTCAIDLAVQLKAQLHLVTVREPLPAYLGYAEAAFPGSKRALTDERQLFYRNLQHKAKTQAEAQGLTLDGDIIEGNEVQSLTDCIQNWQADLLVIGRRHHLSTFARFSTSTVYEVAERTRCSILGVL